jgi:hypothetical protein
LSMRLTVGSMWNKATQVITYHCFFLNLAILSSWKSLITRYTSHFFSFSWFSWYFCWQKSSRVWRASAYFCSLLSRTILRFFII